jgi:hypothetical protein
MLASRVLPPITRPSSPPHTSPVATFFNVPRRYVRSNMQIGASPSTSTIDDPKHSRNLRKSNRIHDVRAVPTSSPLQRTKEEELPSPALNSPRSTKKRLAPLEEVTAGEEPDTTSPTELRSPRSVASNGSVELSPHVCLCQPEPKIPRPRNGESATPLSPHVLFHEG